MRILRLRQCLNYYGGIRSISGATSSRQAKDLNEQDKAIPTERRHRGPRWEIFETIPTGMCFESALEKPPISTFDVWKDIIESAEESLSICSFYWSLRNLNYAGYEFLTSQQGQEIFEAIIAASKRRVKVRIVQQKPSAKFAQLDSKYLADEGIAKVVSLDMKPITGRLGVMHTKFITSDKRHLAFGSPNMDWKSLTEVKEIGVVMKDCPEVVADLDKVFDVYWRIGQRQKGQRQLVDHTIHLPTHLDTQYNAYKPMLLRSRDAQPREASEIYISSSPSQLNTPGRENDLTAILHTIGSAKEYVRIQVMDYVPATLFMKNRNKYWPALDNAIRAAAYRGVQVEILVSQWEYSRPEILGHLRSLLCFNEGIPPPFGDSDQTARKGSIAVERDSEAMPLKKLFTIPFLNEEQRKIDHIRVNHNKFMVTESTAYIGTSNWAGDYFLSTTGVGLIFKERSPEHTGTVRRGLNEIFKRDWNSQYASELTSTI